MSSRRGIGMHLIDEDLGESGEAWLADAVGDEISALELVLEEAAERD